MINLLPPDTKSQLKAARSNLLLVRYNLLLLSTFFFIIVIFAFVYFYIMSVKEAAEDTIEYNISRMRDYEATQLEVDAFKQDLSTAKQIFESDVRYSQVIQEITGVLPKGVVLDTLSLDTKSFGTPTTLATKAKSYPDVLTLKTSLQSSKIFADVSIQSIAETGDEEYPLSAILNVTIRKDVV